MGMLVPNGAALAQDFRSTIVYSSDKQHAPEDAR
jgi:hypothetical protein